MNKAPSTKIREETVSGVPHVGAHQPISPRNQTNMLLEVSEEDEEDTEELKVKRIKANKQLLERARAIEARRRADVSTRGRIDDTLSWKKMLSETQRIREAIEREHHFLSTDQETRIRDASTGSPADMKAYIGVANRRARRLCQENTSEELTLLVNTTEEIVRDLIETLVSMERGPDNARNDGENQSKDSVSVTLIGTSINQCEKIVPPSEGEVKDPTNTVLPDTLSNKKESASRTTRDEIMSLEARRQREGEIQAEHWS
jgi:hypothetical protein